MCHYMYRVKNNFEDGDNILLIGVPVQISVRDLPSCRESFPPVGRPKSALNYSGIAPSSSAVEPIPQRFSAEVCNSPREQSKPVFVSSSIELRNLSCISSRVDCSHYVFQMQSSATPVKWSRPAQSQKRMPISHLRIPSRDGFG